MFDLSGRLAGAAVPRPGPQNASQRADPGPRPLATRFPDGLRRSAARPSVFASPRRCDPPRHQKRTLFLVEDQVSGIRHTARVPHATRLSIKCRVKLAVLVHEHELLAELVLEIPQIAPRPLLEPRRCRKTITNAPQFILVHPDDHNRRHGASQHPSRDAVKAPIAAKASPLGARPSRRRALWLKPDRGSSLNRRYGVTSQRALTIRP